MLKEYMDRGGLVNRNGQLLIFGINRHRAWQIIKKCGDKAGLPRLANPETGKVHHVSPHRLRDAFAVNAVKHDDSGDGLRQKSDLLKELRAIYPKIEDFISSTAVVKINGYVGGYGTQETFEKELNSLGLSESGKKSLLEITGRGLVPGCVSP